MHDCKRGYSTRFLLMFLGVWLFIQIQEQLEHIRVLKDQRDQLARGECGAQLARDLLYQQAVQDREEAIKRSAERHTHSIFHNAAKPSNIPYLISTIVLTPFLLHLRVSGPCFPKSDCRIFPVNLAVNTRRIVHHNVRIAIFRVGRKVLVCFRINSRGLLAQMSRRRICR